MANRFQQWRSRFRVVTAVLFLSGCALSGCAVGIPGTAPVPDADSHWPSEIHRLVQTQEAAVINGRTDVYMQTIVGDDPLYRQEQRRWVDDAVTFVHGKTYRRFVRRFLQRLSPHEVVALVEQSVIDGRRSFSVQVPVRFRRTREGWKDADFPFWQLEASHGVVKVTHRNLLPLAADLLERIRHVEQRLSALYGWSPRRPVTLKLYGDADWFRQSVKLSLPTWVGGWYEDGESIKLLVDATARRRLEERAVYESVVIHEMVHLMLADLTNNNAAYWLHEGLAEHVTALLDALPENDALPALDREPLWSWPELAAVQLERLPPQRARAYYQQARLVVAFLLDCYGDERLQAVFARLQQYPRMANGAADRQRELHVRTVQALEHVLQKPFAELADEWWRWVTAR